VLRVGAKMAEVTVVIAVGVAAKNGANDSGVEVMIGCCCRWWWWWWW